MPKKDDHVCGRFVTMYDRGNGERYRACYHCYAPAKLLIVACNEEQGEIDREERELSSRDVIIITRPEQVQGLGPIVSDNVVFAGEYHKNPLFNLIEREIAAREIT